MIHREVAYALLSSFGINVSSIKLSRKMTEIFVESAYNQFIEIAQSVSSVGYKRKRKFVMNSRDLAPSGSSGEYIRQRQRNSNIVKCKTDDKAGKIYTNGKILEEQLNNHCKNNDEKLLKRSPQQFAESQPAF